MKIVHNKYRLTNRFYFFLQICLGAILGISVLTSCSEEEEFTDPPFGLGERLWANESSDSTAIVFQRAQRLSDVNLGGEWTILAPADEAWLEFQENADLVDNFRDMGLSRSQLITDLLLIPGKFSSADLEGKTISTFGGQELSFSGGQVNGASIVLEDGAGTSAVPVNIVATDIDGGANGVIHLIEKVVVAEGTFPLQTITQLIGSVDSLSTLSQSLAKFPDYLDSLNGGSGVFTLYAPTNNAFDTFISNSPDYNDISEVPDNVLKDILGIHILPGLIESKDIGKNQDNILGTTTKGNKNALVAPDVEATNGLIQVINEVI